MSVSKQGTHRPETEAPGEPPCTPAGPGTARERSLSMRPRRSLRHWVQQLLPAPRLQAGAPLSDRTPGPLTCAQQAAGQLLRALMLGFTTHLTQLARQFDRVGAADRAKSGRQQLTRWLDRPHWEPERRYSRLNRLTRRVLQSLESRGTVPLLVEATTLADGWLVLQVSVPWQGRALPLYRAVTQYQEPEETLPELLGRTLAWLRRHLPGPRSRYVLVMDRGFPSHPLITKLQQEGWRLVVRVKGNWKLTHSAYTGLVRELPEGWVGPTPHLWEGGVLGQPGRHGRCSQAFLVSYHGPGNQEPWFLLTNQANACWAVAIYRQRMQIEREFRDLKGPLGLDHLATWLDRDRVARFLAWMPVYEWRLAYLWLFQQLHEYAERLRVKGELSWIRTVREWLLDQARLAVPLTDGRL